MRQIYNPRTGKIEYEMTPEKGEVGSPGPVGLTGKRGTKWFYGKGEPKEINNCMHDDMYLDLNTGDIYVCE